MPDAKENHGIRGSFFLCANWEDSEFDLGSVYILIKRRKPEFDLGLVLYRDVNGIKNHIDG